MLKGNGPSEPGNYGGGRRAIREEKKRTAPSLIGDLEALGAKKRFMEGCRQRGECGKHREKSKNTRVRGNPAAALSKDSEQNNNGEEKRGSRKSENVGGEVKRGYYLLDGDSGELKILQGEKPNEKRSK